MASFELPVSKNVWDFDPTSIGGCCLWLDGADSNTLFSNTAGTTAATVGGSVAHWKDKSIFGNNATQATAGNQPTRASGGGVYFVSGNSQVLNLANATASYLPVGTSNGTYFTVTQMTSNTNYICGIFGYGVAQDSQQRQITDLGVNNQTQIMLLGGKNISGGGPITNIQTGIPKNTSVHITSLCVNNMVGSGWATGTPMNNTNTDLQNYSVPMNTGSGNGYIGWALNSGGYYWGNISEILFFNTALSNTDRQTIEGYLAWKWNIQASLPTSHPYAPKTLNLNSISPANYSPSLWLDAADSNTIVLSGSNVTSWNDKSGNGRNATTSGSPTYISSSLNGLNGVQISGASQSWATPSFVLSSTSRITAFVVAMGGTKNVSQNINLLMSGTTYMNLGVYLNYSTSSSQYATYVGGAGARSDTTFTNTINVPNIYELVYDSSTASPYVNGTAYATYSAPISGSALTSSQTLVASNGGANTFTQYEVLFFNTNLTTTQRQQIEGYLAYKWGLQASLPSSHPYAPGPTLTTPVPSNYSGLSLWLDASDSSTVIRTGSAVTRWNDKSGNGKNFTTVAGSPTYTSASQGVFFNGTNVDCMQSSSAISYTNGVTSLFAVFKITSTYFGNGYVVVFGNGTDLSLRYSGGGTGNGNDIFNGQQLFYNGALQGIYSIPTGAFNNTSLVNGVVNSTASTVIQLSLGPASVGQPWANRYLTGFVQEVLIFNSALSTTQRQDIEGYLAYKWGLQDSLPTTHPYAPKVVSVNLVVPTNYSGLSLWVDSSDTTSFVTSGTSVTQVFDKSPNKSVLSGTTGFTYSKTANLFNNSYPSFYNPTANTNATLGYNNSVSFNSPMTIFFVGIKITTGTGYVCDAGPSGGTGSRPFLYNGTANTPMGGAGQQIMLSKALISLTFSSSGSLYNNGTLVYSGTATISSEVGITLGNRFSLNESWDGNFCEYLLYNSALTTTQRQQIEGYLANKWGLLNLLPTTHPYYQGTLMTYNPSLKPFSRPFIPTDIESCIMWHDGADTSSMTLSGSSITTWRDKSGNGNNLTNGTTANCPVLTANSGVPSGFDVVFNGTSQSISNAGLNGTNTNTYTHFAVIYIPTGSPGYGRIFSGGTTSESLAGDPTSFSLQMNNTGLSCIYFKSGGGALFTTTPSLNTYYIVSVTMGLTSSAVNFNGTSFLNTGGNNIFGFTQFVLGNRIGNTGYFGGRINESIGYATALTDYQRKQVEGYLAWKWGIRASLPSTHPYYKFPPPNMSTQVMPLTKTYKTAFDPSDLSPSIWIDPQDPSSYTLDANNRVLQIMNKSPTNMFDFTLSSVTSNVFTSTNSSLAVGWIVRLGGAVAGTTPLATGTLYYIATVSGSNITLATTPANAIAGTFVTGITNNASLNVYCWANKTFTPPVAGTAAGLGMTAPLITTSVRGNGLSIPYFDFSNGGNYAISGISISGTTMTITTSIPHGIPSGGQITLNLFSGSYSNGIAATSASIGPFIVTAGTATVIDSSTVSLDLITSSNHGISAGGSVYVNAVSGFYNGNATSIENLTGLTYTVTAASGTSITMTATLSSASYTPGIMIISDMTIRNNAGISGEYIVASTPTTTSLTITTFSTLTAGTMSNISGRVEYGIITITSASVKSAAVALINTRTPHGLPNSGNICMNINRTSAPSTIFQFGGSAGGSATVSGTTLTIVLNPTTTADFTTGQSVILRVLANTFYSDGTTPANSGTYNISSVSTTITLAVGNTITLTIAALSGAPSGALNFNSALPASLQKTSNPTTSTYLLSQTLAIASTPSSTSFTVTIPTQTYLGPILMTNGGSLGTPWLMAQNFGNAIAYYPINGRSIEMTNTGLSSTGMTVVYVTHALDTIAGGSAFNRNGTAAYNNCHAISGANSLNVAGGSTAGSKDFGLVTSFFGAAPRFALNLANTMSDSMVASVDSTSNFRINSIVFNSTTSAVGDVSQLMSGIAQRGWRYDSWNHSGNVRVLYMTSGATIAPTQLRLGGNTNATTSSALNDYWYDGGLGDVLVFSSVLTIEQRQLVEGYLATKYGCQSSSYLGSTSTTYNTTVSYTITSGSTTGAGPYTVTVGGTFTTAFSNGTPIVIAGVTTATGFNGTWILTSSSTSSITFLSPTSPGTWASGNGGTISGVTVSNGNFIHPYNQTLTNISPTLSLTQQYAQGLVGWFDATNSASITFSSGSLVSSWASSGGSVTGLSLAQATALNQPTLVQNAQNGLPGIRFATGTISGSTYPSSSNLRSPVTTYSTNQFLTLSANMEYTWFTVLKRTSTVGSSIVLFVGGGFVILQPNQAGEAYGLSQIASLSLNTNTTYIVVSTRRGLLQRNILIGGGARSITNSTFTLPMTAGVASGYTLGMSGYSGTPSSNGDPFGGDIYEHIMFRYAMTDQQIFQIEGYLAWKWGLQSSLGTTHPYYKTSP